MGEVNAAREEILKKIPKFSIQGFIGRTYYKGEYRRRVEEGLRKAGYPEQPPLQIPDRPASVARMAHPFPAKSSIAVLPFANLSDDKSQGNFADAMTGDLITDLSRIRGAFAIARDTSFTYKGKAANAKDVAKELSVRYVLEGSVRRTGDQVRVNAQLIDGASGAQVWSDKFDRSVTGIYSL